MEQLVWLEGRDACRISVIAHFPDTGAGKTKTPAVIYCHGFTGNKTGDNRMGVKLARALCQNGYTVIRFDYVGSGESEGEFAEQTHFSGWIQDAVSVLEWMKTLDNVDSTRMGLIGHSLGGGLVTYLLSVRDDIRAAVGLAPVTLLEENFREIIIGPKKWEEGLKGNTIRDFYNKKYSLKPHFFQDLLQYNLLERAAKIQCPYLVIHGKEDQAVPLEHSYDLMNALASPDAKLEVFEQESHLFSESIHPVILEWFDSRLKA